MSIITAITEFKDPIAGTFFLRSALTNNAHDIDVRAIMDQVDVLTNAHSKKIARGFTPIFQITFSTEGGLITIFQDSKDIGQIKLSVGEHNYLRLCKGPWYESKKSQYIGISPISAQRVLNSLREYLNTATGEHLRAFGRMITNVEFKRSTHTYDINVSETEIVVVSYQAGELISRMQYQVKTK